MEEGKEAQLDIMGVGLDPIVGSERHGCISVRVSGATCVRLGGRPAGVRQLVGWRCWLLVVLVVFVVVLQDKQRMKVPCYSS